MDLPLGVNDAIHNSTAMMLQVFHGRRIVNGYATGQPLFERRFGAPPLACLAWPPERDHLTDPSCDPEVLGPALDELGVSTIIFEHNTPYHDGFTYEDDVALRERTIILLQGLERIGWLRTLAVEPPYTIFRLSPPPLTQLGGDVGGGTSSAGD